MKSFEHFLSQLATIPDPRRAEGKLYQLPHVLLFSIFAIVSGANSYRGIRTFIKVHRPQLNRAFSQVSCRLLVNVSMPAEHMDASDLIRALPK